jgi:beta-galactosidase
VPATEATIAIPEFKLTASASLWQNLPKPVHSDKPLTMEDIDQAYGYILYRTTLKDAGAGELVLDELHDYAKVYLDGKLVGTLDRRLGQNHLLLEVKSSGARLDILVENTGRVNFSKVLLTERKGITHQVTWAGKPITGWEVFALPMTQTPGLPFAAKPCEGACFYRGEFEVAAPADTFLDTSNFTKGQVWLNGRALGRVWNIGPQKTLYVPQSWLQKGKNEVIVFDLEGQSGRTLAGREKPVLDSVSAAK